LLVKTVFKSHFKIKHQTKSKYIFCKNILTFLLFSKIFFKNCSVKLKFEVLKTTQLSMLKAPSRHKKFFHQICLEFFILKVFYKFFKKMSVQLYKCITLKKKVLKIFNDFGSNILTKHKTILICPIKINFNL
jgi:hypothetical protein